MKRVERLELKKKAIDEIETMRLRIKNHFYLDTSIPRKIIDGQLSKIVEYKNFAKKLESGKCREMWRGANIEISLNELKRQVRTIKNIVNDFGL